MPRQHAKKDVYSSLDALKERHPRWKHYNLRIFDLRAPITVVAPHGGYIEQGTSYLAQRVAGSDCNLFDFQGLLKTQPNRLHVTSVNFQDPLLQELLQRSRLAVSIHSMGVEGCGEIWVGGLNRELRQAVADELKNEGFKVRTDMPKYRGEHRRNFVNTAAEQGVQIEISGDVLDSFYVGGKADFGLHLDGSAQTNSRLESFVKACRKALKLSAGAGSCR
ncbi:MAG: poly-gamma-glutamate hydrolase family protein [Candidatus Obscuribacterales bacterium]|nr:poly-gamma-glutamate hydrolase family protein [Candidatus Obscuribacterales bacterium]